MLLRLLLLLLEVVVLLMLLLVLGRPLLPYILLGIHRLRMRRAMLGVGMLGVWWWGGVIL